jgi:hypothetical protein
VSEKETLRRRITDTSFFDEISTDQLKNRGGVRGKGVTSPTSTHFYSKRLDRYPRRRRERFFSTSDICFSTVPMETNCTLYNPEAEFLDEIQTKKS